MGILFFLLINWGCINAMEDNSHLPTLQLDNCQIIYLAKKAEQRTKLNNIFNKEFPLHTAFCKVKIGNKKNWQKIQFPKYIPYKLLKEVDHDNKLTLQMAEFAITFRCIESEHQKIDFKILLQNAYD